MDNSNRRGVNLLNLRPIWANGEDWNIYTSNGLLVLLPETAEIQNGIGNYAYHKWQGCSVQLYFFGNGIDPMRLCAEKSAVCRSEDRRSQGALNSPATNDVIHLDIINACFGASSKFCHWKYKSQKTKVPARFKINRFTWFMNYSGWKFLGKWLLKLPSSSDSDRPGFP